MRSISASRIWASARALSRSVCACGSAAARRAAWRSRPGRSRRPAPSAGSTPTAAATGYRSTRRYVARRRTPPDCPRAHRAAGLPGPRCANARRRPSTRPLVPGPAAHPVATVCSARSSARTRSAATPPASSAGRRANRGSGCSRPDRGSSARSPRGPARPATGGCGRALGQKRRIRSAQVRQRAQPLRIGQRFDRAARQ